MQAAASIHAQYEAELAAVEALGDLTAAPTLRVDDTTDTVATISPGETKGIYFDSVDYEGNATRVFAYLGLPSDASVVNKVPAVVLVHGGGGSAFEDWVDEWVERGYAAISIDTEGQGPDGSTQHAMAGPERLGIYRDNGNPIEDQFMYHAVAGTVLANSLMRSLPEVNHHQVGVMGISWGGIITCTTIGLDDRFAFAISVYGCGDMHNADNGWGSALSSIDLYQQVWDPVLRLDRAEMPVFWFSWPAENNFPLDQQAVSYRKAAGPRMVSLVPGMGHGHPIGWIRPEAYDFAESVLTKGKVWCEQIWLSESGDSVSVKFQTDASLTAASLITTPDTGVTTNRTWTETSITLTDLGDGIWQASGTLPSNTTAWFINVTDGTTIATSGYQESGAGADILPYYRLNSTGAWQNAYDASLYVGEEIQFSPNPFSGGSWSWSGPDGFSFNYRSPKLTDVQFAQQGEYLATFTDTDGIVTNQIFNVDVDEPEIHVEGEDFDASSGVVDEGAHVGLINHNDWVQYNGVNLSAGANKLFVYYSSQVYASTASIETTSGTVLGTIDLPSTGSWTTWSLASGIIDVDTAVSDVVIRFEHPTGAAPFLCNIDWFEFKPNLALGQATTQSSTGFGGVASRAVDGDRSGNYPSGTITHTNKDENPWWEVDLGEDFSIGEIRIWNRTDTCCTSRLSNFLVSVLNSHGDITYAEFFADYPDPSLSLNAFGAMGRTIRVELTEQGDPLSLAEVEVFADRYITTVETSEDAFTQGGTNASNNYGTLSVLEVKATTAPMWTRRSFIKFPVTGLEGASQVDLILSVFGLQNAAGAPLELYSVSNDTWSESTVTWLTHPATDTLLQSFDVLSGDVGAQLSIDVTSYITGEASGDGTATFVIIQPDGETNLVEFGSKESGQGAFLQVR